MVWWKSSFKLVGRDLEDFAWEKGQWKRKVPYIPYPDQLRQKFTGQSVSWSVSEPAPAEEEYGSEAGGEISYVKRIAWVTWYSHGGGDAWHKSGQRKYDVKREIKAEWWDPVGYETDWEEMLDKACQAQIGASLSEILDWHGAEHETNYIAGGDEGIVASGSEIGDMERSMIYATYINRSAGDAPVHAARWTDR